MFRQFRIGLAVMVPILAIGAGIALSDREREVKNPPSLAGEWLLDRAHSDFGRGRQGGQGQRRGRQGFRHPGTDTPGAPGEGQESGRRQRLPDLIRIEQTSAMLTIADSSGTPLQEIVIGSPANGTNPVSGEWRKDGLEVVRQGPRGKMTQVFALEDKGRVLVIKIKRESEGRGPSREIKRTYRRVNT